MKFDRDLFGRLMIVVNVREVNIREVLLYEIFLVLCFLVYNDGSLRKVIKSDFVLVFEDGINFLVRFLVLVFFVVYIVDGMVLI